MATTATYTALLQVPVLPETRDEIDRIADIEAVSRASVVRDLLSPERIAERARQHNLDAADCTQRVAGRAARPGAACLACWPETKPLAR